MAINFWRYVEYTDDGCAKYQCLSCYNTWEARTAPGWVDNHDKVGEYHPYFVFCPCCGTKWIGQRIGVENNERALGKYRYEIQKKIDERRFDYKPEVKPNKVWVLETQLWSNRSKDREPEWTVERYCSVQRYSAKNMLDMMKDYRNMYGNPDPDEESDFKTWHTYRIRCVDYPRYGSVW